MEGDQTLGGEHTMQYIGNLLQNCTPETYDVSKQCYLNKCNF